MNKCLIDTGPMVALFDGSDKYHEKSVDFIKNYKGKLLTTLASITEAVYLLDFDKNAQLDLLRWIFAGAVKIYSISNEDLGKIIDLFSKYADQPMDFADGCLVSIAEIESINQIATIDKDFEIYRLNRKEKFNIQIGR